MIAFEYEEDWLEKHPGFMLDPALFPFPGRQYAEAGLFGFWKMLHRTDGDGSF